MSSSSPLIAYDACAFFAGSAGIRRFAGSAADALLAGPLAPRVRFFAPSCRRGQMPPRLLSATHFFPAIDPRRGTAFNHLFWANLLAAYLRVRHPDAVFYSPLEVHAFVPFNRAILTIHDCYADRYGDPRHKHSRPGLGRRLRLRQMQRSHLLSVSHFTTRELAELHGITGNRVNTVQNWLPRDFDAAPSASRIEAVQRRLRLPERFWLYVGGFRLNKNLPFLLDAYATARRQRPLPPLVIAGQMPATDTPFSGPLLATLAAHRTLNDSFIRSGFVPDEDLPALYKLASLVVCPSFYEGFGYPVIEAAAVGVPVIAARAASYPELIDNPACFFSPAEPAELVAQLLNAANDEQPYTVSLSPHFLPSAGEARFHAAIAAHL